MLRKLFGTIVLGSTLNTAAATVLFEHRQQYDWPIGESYEVLFSLE